MELNPDCYCADNYFCQNCVDYYISESVQFTGQICTIAELKELFEANPVNTRYQLVVLIASDIWTQKYVKSSVWIEDPSRKSGENRDTTTIACCFDGFLNDSLELNSQFILQNVLIRYNNDEFNDSNARYQIELDMCSQLYRVHEEIPITYNPIKLGDVPSEIKKTENGKMFLDIAAVPVYDFGPPPYPGSPRRIIMKDESDCGITLTLWGEDAVDEKKIEQIMGNPILIRNGLCQYFGGFGGEWQIKHARLATIRLHSRIPRMTALSKWCQSNFGQNE